MNKSHFWDRRAKLDKSEHRLKPILVSVLLILKHDDGIYNDRDEL